MRNAAAGASPTLSTQELILAPWNTNARMTRLLVQELPATIWAKAIPGMPRKTVRALAAHLHNARSGWLNTLGVPLGLTRPQPVNRHNVTRRALVAALRESEQGIADLLSLGLRDGGQVRATAAYVWRNLPLDVGHVLSYFVAHEAHHRGQLVLVARQLGAPVPRQVTDKLWWWQPPAPRTKAR